MTKSYLNIAAFWFYIAWQQTLTVKYLLPNTDTKPNMWHVLLLLFMHRTVILFFESFAAFLSKLWAFWIKIEPTNVIILIISEVAFLGVDFSILYVSNFKWTCLCTGMFDFQYLTITVKEKLFISKSCVLTHFRPGTLQDNLNLTE